jgi:hypothetical protein
MYYNPVNNKTFFYFSSNSFFAFGVRTFIPNHITSELRDKWEHEKNVIRLAPDILGDWNAL